MRFENNSVGVKGVRLFIGFSRRLLSAIVAVLIDSLDSSRLEYNSQVLPSDWTLRSIQ
jgi:hypothetical protein